MAQQCWWVLHDQISRKYTNYGWHNYTMKYFMGRGVTSPGSDVGDEFTAVVGRVWEGFVLPLRVRGFIPIFFFFFLLSKTCRCVLSDFQVIHLFQFCRQGMQVKLDVVNVECGIFILWRKKCLIPTCSQTWYKTPNLGKFPQNFSPKTCAR